MLCEYCQEDNTAQMTEDFEMVCTSCRFEHEVMIHAIDATPAHDGKNPHVFIHLIQEEEQTQLTLMEAKAFLKNLTMAVKIAEEMGARNV